MAQLGYNSADVPPNDHQEYSLMPAGDYLLLINSSELKDGKKPGAKRLIFTGTVQGPTHKGQKLWPEFNVFNPSEMAQKIGRQELNDLGVACGIPLGTLRDSSQLHNKLVTVSVEVEAGTGGYKDKNVCKKFAPAAGGQQRQATAPYTPPASQAGPPAGHPAAEAPAQGAPAVPPWMKQAA